MLYCNDIDTGLNVTRHESELTSDWSSLRNNLENCLYEEKQMVVSVKRTSASSALSEPTWDAIDWQTTGKHVKQLQMRIAKATREDKHCKVKSLQWLLTHSFYAKQLAVKRVVQNRGGKTPGIDKIVWRTPTQKMEAILSLKRRGYRTKPLRRIYISKKDGRQRPIDIPPMKCRAMQALHLLALEPVVEMRTDKNAYGFRPKRSAADAIEQCFKVLSKKGSAQYILEGDIKSCFNEISHKWLDENVIMDRDILRKWLKSGYMEKRKLYSTERGTQQGSLISPTLLNKTMAGLEEAIKEDAKPKDKVHCCIFADDFIATASTKEMLVNQIKPAVDGFLAERGLVLSQEKTKITHIDEGFDFLGHNIRKYKGKLLIKPSKANIKSLLNNVRKITKKNCSIKTEDLILQLNPKVRGWVNYFRHVVSKETFSFIDYQIFKTIWKWSKRRHPNKSARWIRSKYFRSQGLKNWIFYAKTKPEKGTAQNLDLILASGTAIKRHVKIRAAATPYDPIYDSYFKERSARNAQGNRVR